MASVRRRFSNIIAQAIAAFFVSLAAVLGEIMLAESWGNALNTIHFGALFIAILLLSLAIGQVEIQFKSDVSE